MTHEALPQPESLEDKLSRIRLLLIGQTIQNAVSPPEDPICGEHEDPDGTMHYVTIENGERPDPMKVNGITNYANSLGNELAITTSFDLGTNEPSIEFSRDMDESEANAMLTILEDLQNQQ